MGVVSAHVEWRLQVSGQAFPVVLLTIRHVTRSPSFPWSMLHPTLSRSCLPLSLRTMVLSISHRHLANPLTLSPDAHFKLPASNF